MIDVRWGLSRRARLSRFYCINISSIAYEQVEAKRPFVYKINDQYIPNKYVISDNFSLE